MSLPARYAFENGGWVLVREDRALGAPNPCWQSVPPDLYDYQVPHVAALVAALRAHGAALDASDTGTGKTPCACAVAKALGVGRLLVVTKKAILPTWEYWADRFGLLVNAHNYEMARRHGLVIPVEPHLIVFDEVHECSGIETKNAKLLVAARQRGQAPLLMLSATAAESPLKLWAIGLCLGLHQGKDFYAFCHRHGVIRNKAFGGFLFPKAGARHLLKIHENIFPDRGHRMRIDSIPGFPENQVVVQTVPAVRPEKLDPFFKQIEERLLEAAEDLTFAGDESGPLDGKFGGSALTELLYHSIDAELAKAASLVELAQSALDEGHSVVVLVNYRVTIQALQCLGLSKAQVVQGGQNKDAREAAVAAFQSNRARILLATLASGGSGLSLHDLEGGHPRVSLVCPSWSAVILRQALGRIHRAGALSRALQRIVFCKGTIEEDIARRVEGKLHCLDTLNDGDLESLPLPTKNQI